jgi:hypothetical protein
MTRMANLQRLQLTKVPHCYLLLLACSQRKSDVRSPVPALQLYDGPNYRVLRRFLRERGWPARLQVKILSAKYGLVDATALVEPYDQRLDRQAAQRLRDPTLARLRALPPPVSVFVNAGATYRAAFDGISELLPGSEMVVAPGPIGTKMRAMKEWLEGLPRNAASVKGLGRHRRCYLYLFPDWDDYIYTPFHGETAEYIRGRRVYAHEVCGERVPFDGILLSLAHVHVGKGALHRLRGDGNGSLSIREELRVPEHLLLFGDCGAFSYAGEGTPPFTPEQAADLYEKFGFDIGASVDHIPLPEVSVRNRDGTVQKRRLSRSARYGRMYTTRDNAARFLSVCRANDFSFVPMGAIQGIGVQSYVERLHEYLDMGYEHIALGGLVPRSDREILDILCAVRRALQTHPTTSGRSAWLHLFGLLRPRLQRTFRELGVSSFDSASYFRKAWLRSDQNYLAPDGTGWYGTLRVPLSTSKAMRQAAAEAGVGTAALEDLESECLRAIDKFDGTTRAKRRVLAALARYGPLLQRKTEHNHFHDKHDSLLTDRPWERCRCPFCRGSGIHTVVFRGASRNKRRGLHNTWVFYHRILHGSAPPRSSTQGK